MKANHLLTILGLYSLLTFGQVVPNKDYKTILPPPNGQKETFDNEPTALDLTNSAVFISGYIKSLYTGYDYVLAKFDLNGNVLWSKTYDFAGLLDRAYAVTVDNAGNSYVTGASTNSTTTTDIATIKYDINGNQLWVARYNGTANGDDKAFSIGTDNSGNVYVCGYATNIGTGKDFTVIKYNSSGLQQFVYTKNGTSSGDDVANSLAFFGNKVYVTGNLNNTGTNSDIYTTSLNANSAFVNWGKTQNGSANLDDQSLEIKIQGNDILICGGITNLGTNQDYFFEKYNASNGNTVFINTYDAFGGNDFATAFTIDASNTYAIVGVAQNGANYEYHTVKYSNSGVLSWVNQYKTNTNVISIVPKIAVDPIANHFYVSGLALNATVDGALYQITPSGNQTWIDFDDGALSKDDAHVDLSVDNLGRIYLASLNGIGGGVYEIALIRYSQTPVYFPPDLSTEKASVKYLYYPNQGQVIYKGTSNVATDVVFQTMDAYPFTYFSPNRISYKFFNLDTLSNAPDTAQRVDINMVNSSELTKAYPFNPSMGMVSIMDASLPTNEVLDIQGYQRYMIPNVYPNIDLHYYSNGNGLKMYYVVKPGGNPALINWNISGSTSNSIVGSKLQIQGFNAKVFYDQPVAYQVNALGNPITLSGTSSWQNVGANTYSISVPSYNPILPLVIELKYGTPTTLGSASLGNLDFCSYMGGSLDDGFRIIKANKANGWFVCVGQTRSYTPNDFPLLNGLTTSTVSTSFTGNYLVTVLFDNLGVRRGVNIYGYTGCNMTPVGAILSNRKITIVGNDQAPNAAFPVTNTVNLTAGSYTHTAGPGYCIQFEYNSVNSSINIVKWFTRLDGYANDISFKPKSKEIYITSVSTGSLYTQDPLNETGALFIPALVGNMWQNQISKFDSVGFRFWCTTFFDESTSYQSPGYSFFNNGSSNTYGDLINKCKIDCDNNGFVIVGEANTFVATSSKFGAPILATSIKGKNDAFIARFNSNDTITFCQIVGGDSLDGFNNVKITGPNEITAIGYSKSTQTANLTYLAPSSTAYYDAVGPTTSAGVKVLINKFDTIGNRTWGTLFGNGTNEANAWGITQDNTNKLFISGNTLGGMSFPATNQTGTYNKTGSLGVGSDGFILGFDTQNHILWNAAIGGGDLLGRYDDDLLSLDWNPNGNRLMFAGITGSPAKTFAIANLFPATASATYPSPPAWFTDALNATNSTFNNNVNYFDGFYGWFLTNSIIGIQEYFKDKNSLDVFNLYPNPSTNNTYLAFKNRLEGQTTIEIYNQVGQLIFTEIKNNLMDYSVISLNTSALADGIYFVNVLNNNIKNTKKLIVTH